MEQQILTRKEQYALAQKAASGDMEAFEQFYNHHHRRVYCLALRMLKNTSKAEDITQEVFVQLYRKIGTFKGDAAFSTWLHTVTRNQVLMHFRKESMKLEEQFGEREVPAPIVQGTSHPGKMRIVDRIALDDAIAQLPDGYKNVFTLHDVEGFEHKEVARILGCSEGTSKSQLHKARLRLRKDLKKKANPRIHINQFA
jgi:RNA polymerase sigma-70 factor, ECF subfamily